MRKLYCDPCHRINDKVVVLNYVERLIMLCDKARVLARSDRPETMPEIRMAQKGGRRDVRFARDE